MLDADGKILAPLSYPGRSLTYSRRLMKATQRSVLRTSP